MPLKVGKPFPSETNPKRTLSYRMVPTDPDGWVDAKKYLPADYDLVLCKGEGKTVVAWHSCHHWDGLNYKPGSEVNYWKRKKEE
jgi:hypothetical protein